MNGWTPQDVKSVLDGIGKWSIGVIIMSAACYLTYQGKISSDVIVAGASAVLGFYFSQAKTTNP